MWLCLTCDKKLMGSDPCWYKVSKSFRDEDQSGFSSYDGITSSSQSRQHWWSERFERLSLLGVLRWRARLPISGPFIAKAP